ncbi:MAG: hypothetical protein QOG84_590 [Sphingomonadales bacterium]|jgi:hypothetical protein|nr:hypothetical protein [Sphingomonadales bacterium]
MDKQKHQGQPRGAAAAHAQVGNPPGPYWLQVVNSPPGQVQIVVPRGGNLWVYYEAQSVPPQLIEVWHQGGTTTLIAPGENFISVGQGDMILYQLANPAADSIKLAYAIS